MSHPDSLIITYDGADAAAASTERFAFTAAIDALPHGDPTKRFVTFMCVYAREVLAGRLRGPYDDDDAERFARRALIDPATLAAHPHATDAQLADVLGVPVDQLAAARAELEDELGPATGNLAGAIGPAPTPAYLVREASSSEQLRLLWSMTPAQRVAAMRRGELRLEQCFAWAARHPHEVPTIDGALEFLAGGSLEHANLVSAPSASPAGDSVPGMPALDGITLTLDGHQAPSETIVVAPAPHVLVLTTTLPEPAVTLTSTYVGHPLAGTHATHLELAIGRARLHTRDHDPDSIPVTHARDRCLLDHAAMLQELTGALVDVDDVALRDLER